MPNKINLKIKFFITTLLLVAGYLVLKPHELNKEQLNSNPNQLEFTKSDLPIAEPTSQLQHPATPKVRAYQGLDDKDRARIEILTEILKSKNDNDPRMDSEFKNMSAELHAALFEKYNALAKEDRNGRGTISFLIARDLKSEADVEFLRKVYQEPPCVGFSSCQDIDQDNSHLSGLNQTSLNYPQLAPLFQLESSLRQNPDLLKNRSLLNGVLAVLRQAQNFPVPAVKEKAEQIINHIEQ